MVVKPVTSPWVQEFSDFTGLVVRITVVFNEATRALISASLYRDGGCQWTKILVGIGDDGTPDSTPRVFDVSALSGSTRAVTPGQMSALGFDTIEDVFSYQITAGR